MKIIALVEVHPLSGEPSFITARFSSPNGEFDMPLAPEQAEAILRNSSSLEPEPNTHLYNEELEHNDEEFTTSEIKPKFPEGVDEDALVLDGATSYYTTQPEYDDDEL